MSRVLALCADDFGHAPGVSAGIVRLARAHRLSAISCLTTSEQWALDAPLLRSVPPGVERGLHFNLTEGRPLSPRLAREWPTLPSLPVLMARAHAGMLPRGALRSEFHAQLRAFTQESGAPPNFVDGHQHVHALPIVRGIVLDAADHMHPVPALRSTGRVLGPGFGFKRFVMAHSGGRALARELVQREVAHNAALLGVYDFAATNYRALMQGWLREVPREGALLFCHPGLASLAGPPDAIAAARERELAYLESDAFSADLEQAQVALGPVWRLSETSSAD